jgi:hypothetical protein
MSYIERSYEGLRAECGQVQTAEEKTTFRHAMAAFGFLVPNNTRQDLETFADSILAYSSSEQAAECAHIVRAAA